MSKPPAASAALSAETSAPTVAMGDIVAYVEMHDPEDEKSLHYTPAKPSAAWAPTASRT